MADVAKPAFFDWSQLADWSNLGQSFGLVSAVASVFALWGIKASYDSVKKQVSAGRRVQLEINARETFTDYLKIALDNPKFSSGYKGSSDKEFEQYEWYVSYMMNACEGILLHLDQIDGPYWEPTIKSHLNYHVNYFEENDWFNSHYKYHYSEEMCELVDVVKKDNQDHLKAGGLTTVNISATATECEKSK